MAYTPRRYYIYLKFDTNDVASFEQRLTAVLNYLSMTAAIPPMSEDANDIGLIFSRGIQAIEAEMGDRVASPDVVVDKALRSARAKDSRKNKLAELYEREGLDRFVEFCQENEIEDWQQVLEEYTIAGEEQEQTWTEKSRRWLGELLSDGEPRPTQGIKMAGIMSGVIDGSSPDTIERDWGKLSVVAHREGYTSMTRRGEWQGRPMIGE